MSLDLTLFGYERMLAGRPVGAQCHLIERAALQRKPGDDAVVAIASAVAYGYVGLRATVAGLHALRRRAIRAADGGAAKPSGHGPARRSAAFGSELVRHDGRAGPARRA